MSEDINVSIEDIISDEDNDDIGKLHILSLTEFHDALGDTWEAREAKIFLLTESVMRNRIGPGNRWEHQSKEIYIMLFPTLNEMEAGARAYDIAEEVGMKIIGERFDGSRRPLARIAGVDPKDALNADGTLNIQLLEQAGRDGETAGDAEAIDAGEDQNTAVGGKGPDWQKKAHEHEEANTDWRKNRHEHDDHPDDWHKNEHHSAEHDTDWHKQNHEHGETDTNWKERHHKTSPSIDPNWQKMEQEKEAKDDGPQWVSVSVKDEVKKSDQTPSKPKSKYGAIFAPCWDKETESLHIYKAVLTYNAPDGRTLEGPAAYSGHKTPDQRFKVDFWLIQTTAQALFPLHTRRIKTPVFLPVHSTSIRGEKREAFFEGLAKFRHDVRTGYFIIEILDDGKWDSAELTDLTTRLKELVHSVAFRVSPINNFTQPAAQDIDWIGIDLSELNADTGISPELLKSLITGKSATYIFGLTKRDQLGDMLELGAQVISGIALVRPTKKLRPPFDLPIERLQN